MNFTVFVFFEIVNTLFMTPKTIDIKNMKVLIAQHRKNTKIRKLYPVLERCWTLED